MRRMAIVGALAALLTSAPVGAAEVAAKSIYQGSVTAGAAAWTDVAIGGLTCVSSLCRTSGEWSYITIYSSGAAARVLLRAEDGEAATAGMYIPDGGSLTVPVYGAGVNTISVHGAGSTPTVYLVAGRL